MTKIQLSFVIAFSFLVIGCKKDLVDPYSVGGNTSAMVTARAVLVQTVDENGIAISGVEVALEGEYKISDENGVVQFNNVNIPSINATLVSTKTGYFTNQHVINPTASEDLSVVVTMGAANTTTLNATNGGKVECGSGAFIEFPANGFVKLNGSEYNGNVTIASKYVDPATKSLNAILPNTFSGIDEKGKDVFVENHGIILVEIYDEAGNELFIDPKNKAELHIPVLTSDVSSAPDKLPLYYFHEGLGKWVEDGQVKLKNDEYVGAVEHFTFWMCPYVYDHYFLSGKFECSGTPYSGAVVNVYNEWGHLLGSVTTNSLGGFSGSIPGTLTHTLEVEDPCGGIIYSETIGPFTANTNLGTMDLCAGTGVNYGIIEGTVTDCAGAVDSDAYLSVQFDGKVRCFPANALGAFSEAVIFCSATTEVTIIGVNPIDLVSSPGLVMPVASSIDFGNLDVCDAPEEYCSYTYNGTNYYFVPSSDKLFTANLEFSDTLLSVIQVIDPSPGTFGSQTMHFVLWRFNPTVGTHLMPGNSGLGGFCFQEKWGQVGEFIPVEFTHVGSAVGEYIEGKINLTHTYLDGWGTSSIGTASFRIQIDEYNL